MKKTLALILALVLLVSLVGCSTTPTTPVNNGEDQTPPDNQQEEPKDVTWMLVEYSTVKYNNHLEIYQKLEEAGNIKLNILPTPIDAYVDKFSIMMAASEKPDVMSVYGEGVYNTVKDFGPKGMFVPISDHLDQMPNLAKWLEKYESSLPAVTAGDGKLYCMPKVKDYDPIYTGLVMRTDLLEKGGFDVSKMETVDDLYRAFEILKEQNDGRAPFSGRFGLGKIGRAHV